MLASKLPICDRLMHELGHWEDVTILHCPSDNTQPTSNHIKNWHRNLIKAGNILRKITTTIKLIRLQEWKNAKAHYIRIGKYGTTARMTNPKPRTGPMAGSQYPSKPGEHIRLAVNDHERREASLLTHSTWIGDPPVDRTAISSTKLKMMLVHVASPSTQTNHLVKKLNGSTLMACYRTKLTTSLQRESYMHTKDYPPSSPK
jgi:hypothetical protein